MQRRLQGTSVFRTRRSHNSYGILRDELYDKEKHTGETPVRNTVDGRRYAIDQIVWLIRSGDAVTEDQPRIHKCSRIASADARNFQWKDKVVVSRNSPDDLPSSLARARTTDVELFHEIESDLGPGPFG